MMKPFHSRLVPLFVLTAFSLSACQPGGNEGNDAKAGSAQSGTTLIAGITQQNMDITVRPQDDFFEYVNGHWLKNTDFPADKVRIGAFVSLQDQSDEEVNELIKGLAEDTTLSVGSDAEKVADFYRSYMDTETRNQLGLKPIKRLLLQIDALTNKKDLATLLAQGQTLGMNSPLILYVGADDKDSKHYAIHVWQSGLGLPDRDYYFNEGERFKAIREAYVNHIQNMFRLADLPEPARAAEVIMKLENELASSQWSRLQNRDSEKRYNKYPVSELSNLSPDFPWSDFLSTLSVSDQKNIIINQPSFIEGFNQTFAESSLNDWKIYLRFRLLSSFADLLSEPFVTEHFNFYAKTLYGRLQQQPLWKRGVRSTNRNLGELIGKIYVAEYFKPEAKVRMRELVENLRSAYHDSILELDWMAEPTKQEALKKLASFTPKIGYPDRWHDYSKLTIDPQDLVGNVMRTDLLDHKRDLQRLKETVRDWEWGMSPQTVNAYYSASHNEIVFPAAILMPPFFNMAADDAVNYGGIGSVIGHEMGHGFDDQGSKFDGEGNLRNWWTDSDRVAFTQRTDKLVQQYQAYRVFDDLPINGELTLGENIGDLSGLAIAFKAYQKSLNGREAPVIDGFTGDQRFFIGYAQTERSKTREETLRNQIATDPHAPSHFRVLGVLSNFEPFYQTYNVKPGDGMYRKPEDRVSIW